MHQLYEDELFPELEFSRKYSENDNLSQLEALHEHDSSMEQLPKLDESNDSLSRRENCGRERNRYRSRRSEGSNGRDGAVS